VDSQEMLARHTYHVYRTFPHHDFFTDGQGIGQENLFNVLKAYSLYVAQFDVGTIADGMSRYDPQVGYCQGLPFVVAILLLNVLVSNLAIGIGSYAFQMPDEEAFSLLVRLMHAYDLRGHFLPEMPKLQLRLVSLADCNLLVDAYWFS
jgi:hypothetical protein